MDADRTNLIFVAVFLDRNEFEGGFASVKLTTKYRGIAALAQWCSQIKWETIELVIELKPVETVRASTIE